LVPYSPEVIHAPLQVLRDMAFGMRHYSELETLAAAPLPPPIVPNNYESPRSMCMINDLLHDTVHSKKGWEWKDEAMGKGIATKFGYIAIEVGGCVGGSVQVFFIIAPKGMAAKFDDCASRE
jgi:hypothetical protein